MGMQGVNAFSTAVSLMSSAPLLLATFDFFATHPLIIWHASLMSMCSGVGQLFIYHIIERFGAVIFSVAMTLRLVLSVVISIIMFHHKINPIGIVGMVMTFMALGWRIWMKAQASKKK